MKQIHKYIAIIILLIIVFFFGWCSHADNHAVSNADNHALKNHITTNKAKLAVLKPIIIYKDSIQHHWHTKWKEVRHDSLIPCPDKLAVADTVIYQDSSLIASQKVYIAIQDTIIKDQSKVITSDSITITGLKKEVKRQKVQKWVAIGSAFLIGWVELRR